MIQRFSFSPTPLVRHDAVSTWRYYSMVTVWWTSLVLIQERAMDLLDLDAVPVSSVIVMGIPNKKIKGHH